MLSVYSSIEYPVSTRRYGGYNIYMYVHIVRATYNILE